MLNSQRIDMQHINQPQFNPQMEITVHYVGREKNPVIVIDNFHTQPEALIALAETDPPFIGQATDYYPGIRKLIETSYAEQCLATVTPLIRDIFKPDPTLTATQSLCAFSLATTPNKKLRPIQCVPHIDTPENNQFAMIHYLCKKPFQGTSMYRHRSTGYETITKETLEGYFKILKQEVTSGGLPTFEYINGDTPLFERIADIELVFNRAVIYHSNLLHSGNINEAFGLSPNPREGRLTANLFVTFA